MNPGATHSLELARAEHRVATHRSLQTLIAWAAEIAAAESAAGRRVMWAPCHALAGAVSLRTWMLERAGESLGTDSSDDAPTLLSGAADVIVIVDPASADAASLHWLSDLLACAEAAKEVITTAPLPELIVLSQTGSGTEHSDAFIDSLRALGARETRVNGRESDLTNAAVRTEVAALADKYGSLLAAMAMLPCPVDLEDFEAVASAAGAGSGALKVVTSGGLFQVLDGEVVPSSREVRGELRAAIGSELIQSTAASLAGVLDQRFENLPDARIEILMLAGDSRRATRLARKRFDEHYNAGHFEEALRVVDISRQLNMPLESGRHAAEIDEAKLAALHAEVGNYAQAKQIVTELARRRDLFRTAPFVEWLALAARTLAMKSGFEPRTADSLMRRAIRLAGDNLDQSVRLTLLRVQLLESGVFSLDDRATWLLSHINNKMLDEVSPPTLAAYLEVTASRLVARNEFKGAFKRLRRLAPLETSDARKAASMIQMARCRSHFGDHEGALRYASSSLHYAIRAADLGVVERAAKFIKDTERGRPKAMPRMTPPRAAGGRRRLPAMADIPTPQSPDSTRVYEVLESRFGALSWARRRGLQHAAFGKQQPGPDVLTVFQENGDGTVAVVGRSAPVNSSSRGVVLLRNDGDDYVVFSASPDGEPREDAVVRLLLADRAVTESGEGSGAPPTRRTVVDEYLKRAHAHGTDRGLHSTMETLFNKDLLMYLEEQGLTKEEMAERLGVSRATLYRMYARAGLN